MKKEAKTKDQLIHELTAIRHKLKRSERSEAQLIETRKEWERERETFFPILHKAPYGVVLIEKGGNFLYINPEFTRMTGFTIADTLAEKDWFHKVPVFSEYSQEILKTWKADVLQKGLQRILPVVCKEGEIKEIEFKPMALDDGRIIVMLSDVTERKRTEKELTQYRAHLEELVGERTAELSRINEQLQREIAERKRIEEEIKKLNEDLIRRACELEATNKELEAFSYSASHDLRTPLIGINGFSRILLKKYASQLDAKAHQFLSIIQKDSQAMLQLIDNLLSLSRFEHREITSSNIDMMELARTVSVELSNYSPETPETRHELRIEALPPAYGDRMMVRQVFFNLLSNAIKFSEPRETPRIELGCNAGGEQNTYYIRDNGVGFDMQHAQQLFGLFQRFHPSDQFEGTGIGLAIVQRIIQRQGGKVWAEGEIGKGATFYFTLPKGH